MQKLAFVFVACSALFFSIMTSGCSKDLNYIKACEEKDWAKAYEIVEALHQEYVELPDKIENKWYGTSKYKEMRKEALKKYKKADRYVILHEALSVVEEYGENGLIRIGGIIKEHDAKWLYRELIDVAKITGSKDLEERLLEMEIIEIKNDELCRDRLVYLYKKTDFDDLTENEKEKYRLDCEDRWK